MQASASDKVLSRKAQAARRAMDAHGITVEKALRRSLARMAEDSWNLALIARNARQDRLNQEAAAEALSSGDLILLLEGQGDDPGFAVLDVQTVTALVEVQTLGLVTDSPPEERVLTPTDATLAAPLIEGSLARFAQYLEGHPLHAAVSGIRFGAMVDHARIAANLLGAPDYVTLEADLDLGGGMRQGHVLLVLPCVVERPGTDPGEGEGRHAALMLGLPAQLETVLGRVSMPFHEVAALKPGDVLPLPAHALASAELVTGGGHRIARGRMGQLNGQRALRITESTGRRSDAARWETGSPDAEADRGGATDAASAEPPYAASAPPELAPARPAVEPEPRSFGGLDEPEEDLPDLPPLTFDTEDETGEDDDFPGFPSAFDPEAGSGEG